MPYERKIKDYESDYREINARTKNNKTEEYMVHYWMLKFYVKLGVKLTKINRVIKFKQDYICRDCIQNNTNKRNNS